MGREEAFGIPGAAGMGQAFCRCSVHLPSINLDEYRAAERALTKEPSPNIPSLSWLSPWRQAGDRHCAFGIDGGVGKGLHGFCGSGVQIGHTGESECGVSARRTQMARAWLEHLRDWTHLGVSSLMSGAWAEMAQRLGLAGTVAGISVCHS